jgi:hypothetical protein
VNASELYEIVKDVPEAAWPNTNGITYHYRLTEDGPRDVEWWFWGGTEEDPTGHVEARMKLVEAAFVGSMVAHRLKNPSSSADIVHWSDGGYSVLGVTEKFPTLIAALAAACKEARP